MTIIKPQRRKEKIAEIKAAFLRAVETVLPAGADRTVLNSDLENLAHIDAWVQEKYASAGDLTGQNLYEIMAHDLLDVWVNLEKYAAGNDLLRPSILPSLAKDLERLLEAGPAWEEVHNPIQPVERIMTVLENAKLVSRPS